MGQIAAIITLRMSLSMTGFNWVTLFGTPNILSARSGIYRGFSVTVDESIREDERSDDEEKDEDKKDYICQLLNQRMASQRRDKSCAPSH